MKKTFLKKHNIYMAIVVIIILSTVFIAGCVNVNNNVNAPEFETQTESETLQETAPDIFTEPETEMSTTEAEPESETDEPELPYINPLTGEKTAIDYSNIRPVAVMLNTIRPALPQSGNSKADILIEMAEEGGITRIMGVYQDITGIGTIGTVRSTREYYFAWTRSFDAIMVHAGGDSWVLNEIKASGYTTVDCLRNAGRAFWRDPERLSYLSMEHTLYTSSDNLQNWIAGSGIPTTFTKQNNTKLSFVDVVDENVMTEPAEAVKVTFSGYKSTTFKYNEEKNKYDVFFWDNEPYMDVAAGTQVAVTNVIVIPVPNWTAVDAWGKVRQKYDLTGGIGYYFNGGKYTTINWKKGDFNKPGEYDSPLVLTTMDGKNLELAIGKTYICVVSDVYGPVITNYIN